MKSRLIYSSLSMHTLKSFFRNYSFQIKIAEKVFLIITLIFLWINMIILALAAPFLFKNLGVKPDVYHWIIIFYLIIDVIIRLIMTNKITLLFKYLCLNIKRRSVTHFILLKRFLSIFNLNALIFLITYNTTVIYPIYGVKAYASTLIFLLCSLIFITYFIVFLNSLKLKSSIPVHIILLTLIIMITGLVKERMDNLLYFLLQYMYTINLKFYSIYIILIILIAGFSYKIIQQNMYLD